MKSEKYQAITNAKSGTQLEAFFIESLKYIYWVEKHLTHVIPNMIKAAASGELQEVLEEHLEVTKDQVTQVEKVFEMIGQKPSAKKCNAMEALTKEAEWIIQETEDGTMIRDVAIIMASQKVEHYEIATYGTLARLATIMGREDIARLLLDILDEEKEADMTLTGVAENNINVEAYHEAT